MTSKIPSLSSQPWGVSEPWCCQGKRCSIVVLDTCDIVHWRLRLSSQSLGSWLPAATDYEVDQAVGLKTDLNLSDSGLDTEPLADELCGGLWIPLPWSVGALGCVVGYS